MEYFVYLLVLNNGIILQWSYIGYRTNSWTNFVFPVSNPTDTLYISYCAGLKQQEAWCHDICNQILHVGSNYIVNGSANIWFKNQQTVLTLQGFILIIGF